MRTYRELFRAPEFKPLFWTSTVQVAGQTVSGLALSTLVYEATGSPLLSALAMFGPALAQVAGALTLLSAADRLPPRAALAAVAWLFCAGTAAQAVPGLPVWACFALLLGLGTAASVAGGVRYGLLNEVLAREGYLLGRSVLNMAVGTTQICGYALGGVLVAALSPRGALLAGAALYGAAGAIARLGLARRPPRATGRPSVAETWRTNALLWSAPARRRVYLALWVPNGLIVGCESLFVPYAPSRAGLLFAAAALGMLAGDTLTGRFVPPGWRERLGAPLRLLLAVPYLLFAVRPPLPLAVAAAAVASVGYAASLLLQERLMALTPPDLSGHALGLHSSGMLAWQGVSAALAGAVAQLTSPSTAMAVLAAASVAVTAALAPGLRPDRAGPRPPSRAYGADGPGRPADGAGDGGRRRGPEDLRRR
ncbi:MFS transporter [Streptomyces sp. B1866]|uniref:MFS transporter n=1 Tax=Streptomyces sp. B1866 TaxID=3075431 RepID=UPI00289240B0|nr:MFS transporter [Streptomyces sp. B1866]MDT3395564.1 MFS transporter [Streptomyces sp. B1866]